MMQRLWDIVMLAGVAASIFATLLQFGFLGFCWRSFAKACARLRRMGALNLAFAGVVVFGFVQYGATKGQTDVQVITLSAVDVTKDYAEFSVTPADGYSLADRTVVLERRHKGSGGAWQRCASGVGPTRLRAEGFSVDEDWEYRARVLTEGEE